MTHLEAGETVLPCFHHIYLQGTLHQTWVTTRVRAVQEIHQQGFQNETSVVVRRDPLVRIRQAHSWFEDLTVKGMWKNVVDSCQSTFLQRRVASYFREEEACRA